MTKNVDKQGVKKFLVTLVFSHGAWRHMSVYLNKSHAQSLIEDRVESRLEKNLLQIFILLCGGMFNQSQFLIPENFEVGSKV